MKNLTASQVAYKLISQKNRLSFELKEILLKKGFSKEDVEEAIEDLKRYGYLKDELFLEKKIEKLAKKYGPALIKKILYVELQNRIPYLNDKIDDILTEELQRQILEEKIAKAKEKDKKKLLASLLRKGFDQALCLEILQIQIW